MAFKQKLPARPFVRRAPWYDRYKPSDTVMLIGLGLMVIASMLPTV